MEPQKFVKFLVFKPLTNQTMQTSMDCFFVDKQDIKEKVDSQK
jgi:hypothetical protein